MKLSLIALVGSAALAPLGHSQELTLRSAPSTFDVKPTATTASSVTQLPPSPVNGSDLCTTADVIVGTGSFSYDNTAATSGPEGQATTLGGECNNGCQQYANTVGPPAVNHALVPKDVWFSWTAPTTGQVRISTCLDATKDPKIAVYDVPCASILNTCLTCNDDYCAVNPTPQFDATVTFNATATATYLIQVGNTSYAPTASITGTFVLEYIPDFVTTGLWDLGTTDNAIALNNTVSGDGTLMLQGFTAPAGTVTVTSAKICWGLVAFPTSVINGEPVTVAIWDDPNDDKNPADLGAPLDSVATTIQMQGTNTFVTVPFNFPVPVTGVYFIGVIGTDNGTDFYWPLCYESCDRDPNCAWMGYQTAGAYPTTNPALSTAFFRLGAQCGFGTANRHAVLPIRADQVVGPTDTPFTSYCSTGGLEIACPCGNPGVGLGGCGNAANAGGAIISSTGIASVTGDTLVLHGAGALPFGPGLFYQGTNTATGGAVAPFGVTFGNGRRCAGGATPRIEIRIADGTGASATTVAISALGGPIVGGPVTGIRNYQLWYRDGAAPFCTSAGFNLSNAIQLVWTP